MDERVYIEPSIVSYLSARTSRNVILAGQQQVTRIWWREREGYILCTSELVIAEASRGDATASKRRLGTLRNVEILKSTEAAARLTRNLVLFGALPEKAVDDAAHVAIAATHNIDFLLTWNCTHIANAVMRARIEQICRSSGFRPPIICTPDELPAKNQ